MPQPHNANVNVKKPGRGRKLRTLGWTLLTLGLLVAGVWLVSRWWVIGTRVGSIKVAAARGLFLIDTDALPPPVVELPGPNDTPGIVAYHDYQKRQGAFEISAREWAAFEADPQVLALRLRRGFWQVAMQRGNITVVILWPAAAGLLLAGSCALAWGYHVRPRAGRCPRCHYSRAGLAAGAACPECGEGEKATA